MDMADGFIILKPQSEWRADLNKDELIEQIKTELDLIPGYSFEFTQPIEMRFNELMTGVRQDVAIKLFGEDLGMLATKAQEVSGLIDGIDGVGDIRVEASTGLPQIVVSYNRDKLARYGLNVSDVNDLIEMSFGGGKAGVIFEGEKRFDLVVRLTKHQRARIEDVEDLFIDLPDGNEIPLREVAQIDVISGPMQISRDNTNRRTYVGINVRGRDVKSVVDDIQEVLNRELNLPPGYYLRYGGTFENFDRATKRLKILIPIAMGLIFIMIFLALRSVKETLMIYVAVPLAAIGGVFSLWVRDMPFSISAGVGFIVLFGVAVLNGLVLVSGWKELKKEGTYDLDERITKGAKRRIRPILLTALTDILGFLPMALSTSAGAEVQQPLATVVIGGMVSATLLTIIILPLLYRKIESMKHIRHSTLVTVVFLFVGIAGSAQTYESPVSLTIDEAMSQAEERYPKIRAANLEIENREALKQTAWQLGNTQVFTAGEEIENGEGVLTLIGIGQQNIDVFGIPANLKLGEEAISLAKAKRELNQRELCMTVKSSYARLFASLQKFGLYQKLDSNFVDFERAAKFKYENEITSKLEYLAASNQRREVAIRLNQAKRDYHIALQDFNRWLMSDTLFTVNEDFKPQLENEPFLDIEIDNHPMVNLALKEVDFKEQQINAAASDYFPQINLQYGIQEIQGKSGFTTYQAGLQFPLLFFSQKGKVQSAKIQHKIAEANESETRAVVKMQYAQSLENYFKWKDAWNYYRDEVIPFTKEQRKAANIAYDTGEIDYVSYLQNMKTVLELEINAWSAFENYALSMYQLEFHLNSIPKNDD